MGDLHTYVCTFRARDRPTNPDRCRVACIHATPWEDHGNAARRERNYPDPHRDPTHTRARNAGKSPRAARTSKPGVGEQGRDRGVRGLARGSVLRDQQQRGQRKQGANQGEWGTCRARVDLGMRVSPSFALSSGLPKKHNHVTCKSMTKSLRSAAERPLTHEPRSGSTLTGARGFGGREPPEKILHKSGLF